MRASWAPVFAVGLGLCVVESAGALPTFFFGENLAPGGTVSGAPLAARTAFLSNLVGVGTENFESFAQGTNLPLGIQFPGSSGNITANLTGGGGGSLTEIRTSPGLGRFATSGTHYLNIALGDGFTLDFSAPISAFGFYGTDIGDFSGQLLLHLENGSTLDVIVPHTVNAPDGSLLFWGFIDSMNSYTHIDFTNTSGSDSFGYDDMTIGTQEQIVPTVPEPGTIALLGLGLGVGAFKRLRRWRAH